LISLRGNDEIAAVTAVIKDEEEEGERSSDIVMESDSTLDVATDQPEIEESNEENSAE
jgi:hypothetical protein